MASEQIEALMELGREISRTPFWKASLVPPGVLEVVYENPARGLSSDPMLIATRAEWAELKDRVGQVKPTSERIRELEYSLDGMRQEDSHLRKQLAKMTQERDTLLAEDIKVQQLLDEQYALNNEMCAVLERILKQSPWHMSNDEPPVPICAWCHIRVDLFHTRADLWEHGDGCNILAIRALLAKRKEQQ